MEVHFVCLVVVVVIFFSFHIFPKAKKKMCMTPKFKQSPNQKHPVLQWAKKKTFHEQSVSLDFFLSFGATNYPTNACMIKTMLKKSHSFLQNFGKYFD